MHEIAIGHDGFRKHRVIRGRDRRLVKQKARLQQALWEAQWQDKLALLARQERRANRLAGRDAEKALAKEITEAAQARLAALEETLARALAGEAAVGWAALEDDSDFAAPPPAAPGKPSHLAAPEPMLADFAPRFSPINRLFAWTRGKAEAEAFEDYQKAFGTWERAREEYDSELKVYEARRVAWELERDLFKAERELSHYAIEAQERRYRARDPDAIADYCDLQLTLSAYPEFCPKDFEVDYLADRETLIVDYLLPAPGDLPSLKEVKYVASRDAFDEKHQSKTAHNRLYDTLVLQIALRTLHELFRADSAEALAAVAFNGWVDAAGAERDSAEGGGEARICILSLKAGREAFRAIDLAALAPKACFKALKGKGGARPHGLRPVVPVLRSGREDTRFAPAPEAADRHAGRGDPATMGRQAFEGLIRGVFARTFLQGGGDVRVVRARRGGLDAVAVDPDPLRGGKIVIHARQAGGLLGADVVQELYGAVTAEGASRGVLLTTSCYGPDAYAFAKDKPLTLLDGGQLRHLMGKPARDRDGAAEAPPAAAAG